MLGGDGRIPSSEINRDLVFVPLSCSQMRFCKMGVVIVKVELSEISNMCISILAVDLCDAQYRRTGEI